MKIKGAIIAGIILLASCSEQETLSVPDDVLSPDQMAVVLAEAQIIEAALQRRLFPQDSFRQAARWHYEAMFKQHEVTEEQFKRSYDFYREHPAEFELIWEDALNELSRRQAGIRKASQPPISKRPGQSVERPRQQE